MKHTLHTLIICFLALALQVVKAQPGYNDPTFNPNDVGSNYGVEEGGTLYTIAKQSDGKIIIGGDFTSYFGVPRNKIARLNADGTLHPWNPGANNTVYTMVLNGNEIGGGSIRIHDKELQSRMFSLLGFSTEQAQDQFGFLMNAFQFGAPPHGGLAFGLDRLVAILGGQETIRDFIAFPKNNSGRDVMIDAPSAIDEAQLKELYIKLDIPQ
jgi:hypothetical protein